MKQIRYAFIYIMCVGDVVNLIKSYGIMIVGKGTSETISLIEFSWIW